MPWLYNKSYRVHTTLDQLSQSGPSLHCPPLVSQLGVTGRTGGRTPRPHSPARTAFNVDSGELKKDCLKNFRQKEFYEIAKVSSYKMTNSPIQNLTYRSAGWERKRKRKRKPKKNERKKKQKSGKLRNTQ